MTIPEHMPPPAAGNGGKPSLIAAEAEAASRAESPSQPMRLLDGLGPKDPAGAPPASRGSRLWTFGLLFSLVAVVALWAWTRADDARGDAATSDTLTRRAELKPVPASRSVIAAAPAPPASEASPGPVALASTGSTAGNAASAARIEPFTDAGVSPAPAGADSTRLEPAASSPATAVPAVASVPPAQPNVNARTVSPPSRTTAPRSAGNARAARSTSLASASSDRRAGARASARTRSVANRAGDSTIATGDPDVTLMNAMLARMSSEGGVAAAASGRPTIAQLVERCAPPATRDASEAFECKRRICAGYWGKAEACPSSLAPKRN